MNATHSLPSPFHFPADNNDEKARHLMFHFYPAWSPPSQTAKLLRSRRKRRILQPFTAIFLFRS